jgi:transglutaminase-like putative cysteine protease
VALNRAGTIISWTIRILATLFVIAVPVLGVWVGSSLAAYLNGPVWLVCLAGLLLFPGLPVGWTWWSRRRAQAKPRVLTFWDQVFVRTFVINGLFLGALLWASPQTASTAVSSRGDWMLEGLDSAPARRVREWLHGLADRFDWLYESSHENEYEDLVDVEKDAPKPDPSQQSDAEDPWKKPFEHEPAPPQDEATEPQPLAPGAWPQPAELHPAVTSMPPETKASVESIGRWIAERETDPYHRVKAIHDFVADHVAYDAPALAAGNYPPQDADTVLRAGVGVCAGYANLMKAIADVTGDEIVIVVGDARGEGGAIDGRGHAWNAARIEGKWYLLDATWDAGSVNGATFEKRYSTGYLFVPPGIMGITHFPEDPVWQLEAEPLSRGDFVRQPMMRPEFFANGLSLQSPNRSQITVDDEVEILVGNPQGVFLMAKHEAGDCEVSDGQSVAIRCAFASEGTYHVRLFASHERYGTYPMVGELAVNAR